MPDRYRVALQGFSDFERSALAAFFRLSGQRTPAYVQADTLAQADFVIADADHPGVIDEVLSGGRLADTVFVGAQAPEGATAWMLRPIDPLHVQRELDAMVALRHPQRSAPTLAAPLALPAERPEPRSTPLRRAYEAATPQSTSAPDAAADVLLVDDSEVALRFLERLIQRHGLHPRSAQTSGEALALMTQQRFAAVFLDVELGDDSELDGLALCQRIKRQPPQQGRPAPAVVLVSAHGEAVDRVRGTLAGCDAYLTKPLDEDELKRTLRKLGVGSVAAGVRP
jgi:CheY-like chemotaxis protein